MEKAELFRSLLFYIVGSFLHKDPLCARYLSEGLQNFTHPLPIAEKAERGCPALYVLSVCDGCCFQLPVCLMQCICQLLQLLSGFKDLIQSQKQRIMVQIES